MSTGFSTMTSHQNGITIMQESNSPLEENAAAGQPTSPIAFKKKRAWTEEEKRAIVEQCREPGATVSGVARKNGAPANLVFQWRKLFEETPLNEKLSISDQMEAEMRSTLEFIQKCVRLEQVLTGNLLEDVRAKKISPYNASIALSNLVNCREKVVNLSLNLLERLDKIQLLKKEPEPEVDEIDLRYRREIEKLAVEMANYIYPANSAEL